MALFNRIKAHLADKHVRHWISILALMGASVVGMNNFHGDFLYGSVLDYPDHAPFDGTVMPVDKVPDWARLSGDQYYWSYDQFLENAPEKLIPVPLYDNDLMTYDSDDLGWRQSSDLDIRTFKSTYPVGYLDNYDYSDDSGDYSGGHNAIDIKVPFNTPIRAIANGTVIKSGWSSGYGYTVVLLHKNVPNPDGDGTVDVYSSYSHNQENLVSVNDVIRKGQVIAKAGDTGTATTHHIHLQLDRDDAPFYPYWPFTAQDAANAGINFWEGVDSGLGRENSERYSYHPLNWVNANLDSDFEGTIVLSDTDDEEDDDSEVTDTSDEEVDVVADDTTSEDTTDETEEDSVIVYTDFSDLKVDAPSRISVGDDEKLTVRLYDEDDNRINDPAFTGDIRVSISDAYGSLSTSKLQAEDFNNGKAEIRLYAEQEGDLFVSFDYSNRNYYSEYINFYKEEKPFDHFAVVSDGSFGVDKVEVIQVQTLDENGQLTTDFPGDGTVELSFTRGSGLFADASIRKEDFVRGIAEVQFRGKHNEVIRVKATYGTLEAESGLIQPSLYSDVNTDNEFYTAVGYLYASDVMRGYPDGTARLENSISRVEVLKMIFEGVSLTADSSASFKFPDAYTDEWYSPYLGKAYSEGIVKGYPDGSFKPTQGVTRVEFLKMLTMAATRSNTMDVSLDPVILENPYADVDRLAWYASYVNYAEAHNLFPVEGNRFDPARPMTRGEVAEVIYRLIVSQQNNGAPFSVLLSVADPA